MFFLPLFGLGLTLVVSLFAIYLKKKISWYLFNPMLFSTLLIIAVLIGFNIPYENYAAGGDYILKLLGPITVVLAVPLYEHRQILKKQFLTILLSIVFGSLTAILSVYIFSLIADLDMTIVKSLLPHSITTPIGIEASKMIGGLTGLTILSIVITGISGAIMSDFVFKHFKINDPVAKGISLGTAAHAIGTGRALEYGTLEGAISGLSISIAGISTILWLQLFKLIGFI
jgi:predicted murein hydrolase (TIGR00659 family)